METVGISLFFVIVFLLFLLFGYSFISELRIRIAKLLGSRKRAVLPTLVVGNITVGGSGKTPFVQFLSDKLQKNAVLLRGYGRKTKGFIEVTSAHQVLDVGDEALEHFDEGLKVFVGENRIEAIEKIQQTDGNVELVILDDGLQHAALEPHCGLLLTDYQNPFWRENFSLPLGKLRQFKVVAHGFDAWVVTKCPPSISAEEMNQIKSRTSLPVFFASYKTSDPCQNYGAAISLNNGLNVGLITGIVNGRRLRSTLEKRNLNIVKHWEYSDHYLFGENDLKRWVSDSANEKIEAWICSRKDFMRMRNLLKEIEVDVPIFEVHTEVGILNSEEEKLLDLIKSKTQK